MGGTIDDVFKEIEKIDSNLQNIEGTLSSTLPALVTNASYVSQALAHIMKQNEAVLCNLGHIATNTCGALNEATEQTRLQRRIEAAAERMKELLSSAYSAETVNLERLEHLRRDLEKCCPKEPPPPACADKPCPDPGPGPQPPDTNPIP